MLVLVIAWAILRQALLFFELAAPMCVLILVIGGIGWHLLHVFSHPKDKLYLWPFFDFDDDDYYALNEEEIDNLVSVDPREPLRVLYTDDIFTWHEYKSYTYIHPRELVSHWSMHEAEEDPYGDMEDDAYQELKRADFVLGSDLYGENETREEL